MCTFMKIFNHTFIKFSGVSDLHGGFRFVCRVPRCYSFESLDKAVCDLGWDRGVKEFESASVARDVAKINSVVVTRDRFLQFWFDGSDEKFSFLSSWRLIDQVRYAQRAGTGFLPGTEYFLEADFWRHFVCFISFGRFGMWFR